MREQKRYPENAPGDFYVEADLCILCGAPAAVSPDLVEMNEQHCYFKKQPTNRVELERAIEAVNSCCCVAYRYCGDDRDVIARLGAEACDNRIVRRSNLVTIVLFSFLVGMHFTFGIEHLRTGTGEDRWILDFFLAVLWLTGAVLSVRRHLKEVQQAST
jgi:ferredoxin